MRVYADNAATMRMRESAYNAMLPYLREDYGNPSSIHDDGLKAHEAVEAARKTIAECIGAKPNEIYFTSGATESNNWAVKTAMAIGGRTGNKHLISASIEHSSVLESMRYAQAHGFQIKPLLPNKSGIVSERKVNSSFDGQNPFVSVMYANNEIGTIQPIREIGKICCERGIIFHTDATQAIGHISVNVKTDNIDMLSCSAHKFGGAKGIGFLYCRQGINLSSFHFGGSQERGRRAGTLNVPAIVSMAVALKESVDNMEKESEKVLSLRNRLLDALLDIPDSYLNGDRERRLPNNINIRFDGVEGEALVQMLSSRGIMISSGSACSSGSLQSSHVLRAIGLSDKQAHESVRISLSHENTEEEIDYAILTIKECVSHLRSLRSRR